jgi:hypothetical protein
MTKSESATAKEALEAIKEWAENFRSDAERDKATTK